ncbi:hypothetical protein LAUMK4_01186 [Mycobacterium persicum]|uniref:Uncharacterized protein n=1 Tax=Mycobacterium persicum TaxID=1487726 RepID=A0AB38UPW6_9MYCO|nr:hypothetical protein LAUMK15_01543 [Mycobacterium persicum]VAZ82592.1 hypothetical protein LAUMK42_01400 [Mycobacterium persicum]VAZ89767.1 hypothetical protein LAUMK4_01186 [Mycobacterium persicum]
MSSVPTSKAKMHTYLTEPGEVQALDEALLMPRR